MVRRSWLLNQRGYLVIALLADLALLGYLVLRAGWDTPPVKLPIAHAPLLLIATGVQLLFVLIAFLQSDGLGHEFGAYLALLAALVACGAGGLGVRGNAFMGGKSFDQFASGGGLRCDSGAGHPLGPRCAERRG